MRSPIIGITTSEFKSKHELPMVGTTRPYIDSVLQAGGIPVLIPSGVAPEKLETLAAGFQGILFSGGSDIAPQRYGGADFEHAYDVDPARDDLEIGLVRLAVEMGLPFLGICRGQQVVNVALGGTLITDIATALPDAARHDYYPDIPRTYMAHNIHAEPGSRLYEIMGARTLFVNSLHHQAVKDVAPGLAVSVKALDGVIEGLELAGHPFGVTVQWHPEWLQTHTPMQAIFKNFIKAAQEMNQKVK